MIAGHPLAPLEEGLATALSASLLQPAPTRASYIALRLLKELMPEQYDIDAPPPLQAPPEGEELKAAVQQLQRLTKEAVNSAVRRASQVSDTQTSVVERIADYLLLLDGGGGLFVTVDDAGSSGDPWTFEPDNLAAAQSANLNELARMREQRSDSGKHLLAAAIARAPRRKVSYARIILGRAACSVMPAVVGAFQDHAARHAARIVNEQLIAESIKEGERVSKLAAARERREAEQEAASRLGGLPKGILPSRS